MQATSQPTTNSERFYCLNGSLQQTALHGLALVGSCPAAAGMASLGLREIAVLLEHGQHGPNAFRHAQLLESDDERSSWGSMPGCLGI